MADDVLKLDLYKIIGVNPKADESEIKKAYRKKALSCHPDKNPDNPKAAELFLQLSKVLAILTDVSARAAYDKVVIAREQTKLRASELNAKRKKLKDDLEAREEAFKRSLNKDYAAAQTDEEKLKAEIERLRKEGSKLVEEEKERLRKKVLEDLLKGPKDAYSEEECRVKIRWKVAPDDENNGGYNKENLHQILFKHGEISVLILSEAKKGRALVEFTTKEAAMSAVNYEVGLVTNPLKLEGMWEKGKVSQSQKVTNFSYSQSKIAAGSNLFPSTGGSFNTENNPFSQGLTFSSAKDIFNNIEKHTSSPTLKTQSQDDLEKKVLNELKRAEERKRLIEQMQAEDAET